MKYSIVALAAAGAQLVSGHTTVWNIAVNGADQGVGKGVYIDSPPNNNPITDVTSSNFACNVPGSKASKSVAVKGGDKIAFEWHHDTNSASDDIIASSHHGPIMVYASKAGGSLSWTKLWEDTYDGKWAVDKIIAGSYTGKKGQHEFTLPNLAPGNYILRPEIAALHEGNKQGGTQFYMACVYVTVGGAGSLQLPSNGVSFPGAYKATDAGVLFNIYTSFSSYPGIGPKVWNGASTGGNNGGNTGGSPTTLATSARPTQTGGSSSGGIAKYGQCGGSGYSGPTTCASGLTCTKSNDYYSQCL